ncbi:phosphoenolpyruvate synthase/pyruvate phosphate dikinase [Pelotomaculum thermopropionicum SI]|uniref:Phosphoenolpyruvate synthase/pyruvate phosphate dikinase n=1 Tax=Pelotomaculum thermopropionicum (strain DSM 13744 / JCM 10971 / SI) TaxID=370438 RepID=A5CZN1_PELTS|nr:phosphoenolpyruvate synthase/pyruvate phosphate dikinase [Pelotomaculum thermopropionicum SI]
MNSFVLWFREIDRTKLAAVGGKGVNLGELSRIAGIRVPEGFCVTTEAYKRTVSQNPEFNALLDRLSALKADDREGIGEISAQIRRLIEGTGIAADMAEEIARRLAELGEESAFAVRSSATAEDLPQASFAGQQDTYLNVRGKDAVLRHVSKCWASLFTDRAVVYRLQNGFDHRKVYLSVVIQRMVFPEASGIMFTADPVTSNRKVLSIDAGFGLGEALVSGLVNPDNYKVREGRIVDKKIPAKKTVVHAKGDGGTEVREIEPGRQNAQVLADEQILELAHLGRKIEAHFGRPQDIEWCLAGGELSILQSRPITTLFPVPENDGRMRIYVSFGHQQMMTDPIRPLGMSFFQFLAGNFPLRKAGGRLFWDVTHDLASPVGRRIVLSMMSKSDPLIVNAIRSLMRRKGFLSSLPRGKRSISMRTEGMSWALLFQIFKVYRKNDPAVVQDAVARCEASINELRQRIADVSGDGLFAFILEDQKQTKAMLYDPRGYGAIMAGVLASVWINSKMEKWLGEKSAADTLAQSVPNNVTSEMGLALLDVADVVRQHPAVIEYFHRAGDETFFADLAELEGGEEVARSLRAFLEKYGMRCSGEIDITRPRWNERPTALIPAILSNVKNFAPGARGVIFEERRQEAEQKEKELLSRLERLPGGRRKAKKTKRMISLLRNYIGYREIPQVRPRQALLDLQAGAAEGGRRSGGKGPPPGKGGRLLPVL